jgi:hypothetical protein
MAYVVSRPHGRWEIRESYSTPRGPRARTLVGFTALNADLLERAAKRAQSSFDPEQLVHEARRKGVPFEPPPADDLATRLLHGVVRGEKVRPGIVRLLRDRLPAAPRREVDESLADWLGATEEERGIALVDLLGLADRLPKPRRGPLAFPRLVPHS